MELIEGDTPPLGNVVDSDGVDVRFPRGEVHFVVAVGVRVEQHELDRNGDGRLQANLVEKSAVP